MCIFEYLWKNAFTPSLTLPPSDFCMFESPNESYSASHCNFKQSERTDGIICVIRSTFTNFIGEYRCGGAIRIVNYGFKCNAVSFNDCVTKSCGGGAIYIKNSLSLDNNFDDAQHFSQGLQNAVRRWNLRLLRIWLEWSANHRIEFFEERWNWNRQKWRKQEHVWWKSLVFDFEKLVY